jgi:hypothetical protein
MLFSMMPILFAQEFHDIAPPVDYSLIPTWLVFVAAFVGLSLIGGIVWWLIVRHRRRAIPPQLPRERALAALNAVQTEIGRVSPYQFSIRVSDILRSYVTDQFGLPVTRQTSVEFLEHLHRGPQFSEDEKQLLQDFLNRCDLIKFARYEATAADSELLLEEAMRFVEGGQVTHATA